METAVIIAQLIIFFGILNVWIFRFNKCTDYRPASASNMKEEFASYNLPEWFVYFIGILKLVLSVFIMVGIWIPELVVPAAIGMALLMVGAIIMHLKVKDPFKKSIPAIIMLLLSLFLVFSSSAS